MLLLCQISGPEAAWQPCSHCFINTCQKVSGYSCGPLYLLECPRRAQRDDSAVLTAEDYDILAGQQYLMRSRAFCLKFRTGPEHLVSLTSGTEAIAGHVKLHVMLHAALLSRHDGVKPRDSWACVTNCSTDIVRSTQIVHTADLRQTTANCLLRIWRQGQGFDGCIDMCRTRAEVTGHGQGQKAPTQAQIRGDP